MFSLLKHVDLSKPSLYLSLASITFNPTAWNIVARNGESLCSNPRFSVLEGERFDFYVAIFYRGSCSTIDFSFDGWVATTTPSGFC